MPEIDGIQKDPRRDRPRKGEESDHFWNTDGKQDRQDDHRDRDHGPAACHRSKDKPADHIHDRENHRRIVSAKLDTFSNDRGRDTGIQEDSPKEGP